MGKCFHCRFKPVCQLILGFAFVPLFFWLSDFLLFYACACFSLVLQMWWLICGCLVSQVLTPSRISLLLDSCRLERVLDSGLPSHIVRLGWPLTASCCSCCCPCVYTHLHKEWWWFSFLILHWLKGHSNYVSSVLFYPSVLFRGHFLKFLLRF